MDIEKTMFLPKDFLVSDSLTLRDWFATHAPPPPARGNFAYKEQNVVSAAAWAEEISEWAYIYAEAMLAERVKNGA